MIKSVFLNENITQSLAGRVGIIRLLPLTYREVKSVHKAISVNDCLFQGGYPRLYNENIRPSDFFSSYLQTYVERDVRSLKNIDNLHLFQKFLLLCAGRAVAERIKPEPRGWCQRRNN